MRWLWTGEAVKAHAVFVILIALLTSALLAGNHGPAGDYPHASSSASSGIRSCCS